MPSPSPSAPHKGGSSASVGLRPWYRRLGPSKVLITLGLVTVFCAALLTAARVYQLERNELEYEGDEVTLLQAAKRPGSTSRTARLSAVELQALDRVVFEVCSADTLAPERWAGTLDFAVLKQDPPELMLRVPLDAEHLAHAERNATGACLFLGSGQLEHGGTYSVEAVYPEDTSGPAQAVRDVPLRARTLARGELTRWDRGLLWLGAYGILLLLLGLWVHPTSSEPPPTAPAPGRGVVTILAAAGIVILVYQAPLWGATLGFVKGLMLALTQAGLALVLARGHAGKLGLRRPPHVAMSIALALVAAFILAKSAGLWQRLLPSTGTAPIETFISWPSGLIAFAVLGVLLPLAEELFFRGFAYQWLLGFGRATAFTFSLLAFVALHLQQTFGNWGSLMSIAATGFVLTALRAVTGSTLVPAVTHVAYNLMLSAGAF